MSSPTYQPSSTARFKDFGQVPGLDRVPPEAVEYVRRRAQEMSGQRIGPVGTLESERMLRRCRELVRDRLGVVWEPTRVREVAKAAMRQSRTGRRPR
jgi:hypothetical protein